MAKSKHSPALFEVVHGKKHVDKTVRTGALRTPTWWFKGRQRMTDAGLLAPPSPGEAAADAPGFVHDHEPVLASSGDDPTANASALTLRGRVEREIRHVVAAEEGREPEARGSTVRESDAEMPPEEMTIPPALTEASPQRRSPFQYVLDRDRHELYVRVRYTTAIVAGFSVLVLVGFAYVTGRHLGRGPSAASAGTSPSAEEIAAGPVEKGVFDLASRGSGASGGTGASTGASTAGIAPGGAFSNQGQRQPATRVTQTPSVPLLASQPQARAAGPAIEPPPGPPKNVNRTLNLQYVIVQSYPEKEKQMADEACDYLNRAGIPCTVEKGVVGYTTADWYCVVGTTPFEKASGPVFAKYLDDIEAVNKQFAGKSRFKRFAPQATRWRGVRAGG